MPPPIRVDDHPWARRWAGRRGVHVAQSDTAKHAAFDAEVELQVLPARHLDGNSVHDRSQDRSMKHDQQEKNGCDPDEEPADPTSAAARRDICRSIFGHEAVILREKHQISTAPAGSGLTMAPV